VGRNAVDVKVLSDVRHRRGRRNRVVPTPRRWRQVSRRLQRPAARRWWQSSIGSPRRARISRKPLRREGRSVSACTCGFRARANLLCAGAPGAAATRPFLRPPYSRRVTDDAKLGRNSPRERETVSAVLRGSCFETLRSLCADPLAAPQNEAVMLGAVSDPHGEEARKRCLEPRGPDANLAV
jgi:hypothetical protein